MAIAIIFAMCITGCKNNKERTDSTSSENETKELFYGKIVYTSSLDCSDSVLRSSLLLFSPGSVEVFIAENKFRMIEHGGLSHGNILIFTDIKEAWQLDTVNNIAYLCEYSDLGDPGATLKNTMPDHFAPTVEKTNEKETIAGVPCTKYKIIRSGFIPASDEAWLWAADNLKFPSVRFDVQSEINRATVPPPMYIGFEEGAVMRLMVKSKSYSRTFEVTELGKNNFPEHIFEFPAGMMKK